MDIILEFLRAEDGTAAYEYGLLAALLSVAAAVSMKALGSSLTTMFNATATTIANAVTP